MAKAASKASEKEKAPAASQESVATYNPETHIVVNKVKFEQMMFHLGTDRVKTFTRQNVLHRLAELLDLKGGPEEARPIYSKMLEKVTAG